MPSRRVGRVFVIFPKVSAPEPLKNKGLRVFKKFFLAEGEKKLEIRC